MTGARDSHIADAGITAARRGFSLYAKAGVLLVVLALAVAAGLAFLNHQLLLRPLTEDQQRYEIESALRIKQQLGALLGQTEATASMLSQVAGAGTDPAQMQPTPDILISDGAARRSVVGVGLWPEMRNDDAPRRSRYWLWTADGDVRLRTDYNDRRVAPYFHESWYTPARYAAPRHCAWTAPYRHPLAQKPVVTCAMPIRHRGTFSGVITVDIDVAALNRIMAEGLPNEPAYSLLLTADNHIIATSPRAQQAYAGFSRSPELRQQARNLAELAQQDRRYNPLALALHAEWQALMSAAQAAEVFDASTRSRLQNDTRALSAADADTILAILAANRSDALTTTEALPWKSLPDDAVFGTPVFTWLLELPGTRWRLLRVTEADKGYSALERMFGHQRLLAGAFLLVAFLSAYLLLTRWVLRPVRDLADRVSSTKSLHDLLLTLDESGSGEVSQIARGYNDHMRQLRELANQSSSASEQLAKEAAERRLANELADLQRGRVYGLLNALDDAVLIIGASGRVELASPSALKLLGVKRDELLDRPLNEVVRLNIAGTTLSDLASHVLRQNRKLEYHEDALLATSSGEISVKVVIAPVFGKGGRALGTLLILSEVGRHRRAESSQGQAIDPISGLPGRIALDHRLRRMLDTAAVVPAHHALLQLDVDRLQDVNDALGRSSGDELLAKLGELLVLETQRVGSVFHLGGDQYAVVVGNIDAAGACAFAEELREAVSRQPVRLNDRSQPITVSVGVAPFGSLPSDNPAAVVDRAEAACAAAKLAGRNQVVQYEPELHAKSLAVDDKIWIRRIRNGLQQNLFHLTSQHVDAAAQHGSEGKVFEILLALEDEEGFWNEAKSFVSAAERHHLSGEMDRWVISHLLRKLSASRSVCDTLSYAVVRLSALSLADQQFLDYVVEQLAEHDQVEASKLCFEVREEAVLEHPAQAQTFFRAAAAIGCRLCVGNFHSTRVADLSLLRALPLNLIKINASSFPNLEQDPVEQFLAESTVRLARTLGKRVVVSQIEAPWQLSAWRKLGCDYYVGNAIARPSPILFMEPQRG